MKNKRSARLGFVAAIWLVLSVAVFGTLIGIAWMSMNATADVSADVFVVDSVDESALARAPILDCRDRSYAYDCVDRHFEDVIMGRSDKNVVSLPLFIGDENPTAPGYMLVDRIGDENPNSPGHLREWIGNENPKSPGHMREWIGNENPGVSGFLRDS